MLFNSLILLILSNSITSRRDKSILYSRSTILILLISAFIAYNNLSFLFLAKGIGKTPPLFHTTFAINNIGFFTILIISVVLLLISFYYKKVHKYYPDVAGRIIIFSVGFYLYFVLLVTALVYAGCFNIMDTRLLLIKELFFCNVIPSPLYLLFSLLFINYQKQRITVKKLLVLIIIVFFTPYFLYILKFGMPYLSGIITIMIIDLPNLTHRIALSLVGTTWQILLKIFSKKGFVDILTNLSIIFIIKTLLLNSLFMLDIISNLFIANCFFSYILSFYSITLFSILYNYAEQPLLAGLSSSTAILNQISGFINNFRYSFSITNGLFTGMYRLLCTAPFIGKYISIFASLSFGEHSFFSIQSPFRLHCENLIKKVIPINPLVKISKFTTINFPTIVPKDMVVSCEILDTQNNFKAFILNNFQPIKNYISDSAFKYVNLTLNVKLDLQDKVIDIKASFKNGVLNKYDYNSSSKLFGKPFKQQSINVLDLIPNLGIKLPYPDINNNLVVFMNTDSARNPFNLNKDAGNMVNPSAGESSRGDIIQDKGKKRAREESPILNNPYASIQVEPSTAQSDISLKFDHNILFTYIENNSIEGQRYLEEILIKARIVYGNTWGWDQVDKATMSNIILDYENEELKLHVNALHNSFKKVVGADYNLKELYILTQNFINYIDRDSVNNLSTDGYYTEHSELEIENSMDNTDNNVLPHGNWAAVDDNFDTLSFLKDLEKPLNSDEIKSLINDLKKRESDFRKKQSYANSGKRVYLRDLGVNINRSNNNLMVGTSNKEVHVLLSRLFKTNKKCFDLPEGNRQIRKTSTYKLITNLVNLSDDYSTPLNNSEIQCLIFDLLKRRSDIKSDKNHIFQHLGLTIDRSTDNIMVGPPNDNIIHPLLSRLYKTERNLFRTGNRVTDTSVTKLITELRSLMSCNTNVHEQFNTSEPSNSNSNSNTNQNFEEYDYTYDPNLRMALDDWDRRNNPDVIGESSWSNYYNTYQESTSNSNIESRYEPTDLNRNQNSEEDYNYIIDVHRRFILEDFLTDSNRSSGSRPREESSIRNSKDSSPKEPDTGKNEKWSGKGKGKRKR